MYSILRPELIYQNVSADILEHDEDYDASEWSYSGKQVYRGALDRSYTKWNLDIFWLYDESLQRVGLAEHESDDPSIFEVLWFHDNPFGTLLYKASYDQEEIAVVDIDTEKSDSYRTHWPFLRDRRIDSYEPITKRYLDDEQ